LGGKLSEEVFCRPSTAPVVDTITAFRTTYISFQKQPKTSTS